jgi:hypothetical protein
MSNGSSDARSDRHFATSNHADYVATTSPITRDISAATNRSKIPGNFRSSQPYIIRDSISLGGHPIKSSQNAAQL